MPMSIEERLFFMQKRLMRHEDQIAALHKFIGVRTGTEFGHLCRLINSVKRGRHIMTLDTQKRSLLEAILARRIAFNPKPLKHRKAIARALKQRR